MYKCIHFQSQLQCTAPNVSNRNFGESIGCVGKKWIILDISIVGFTVQCRFVSFLIFRWTYTGNISALLSVLPPKLCAMFHIVFYFAVIFRFLLQKTRVYIYTALQETYSSYCLFVFFCWHLHILLLIIVYSREWFQCTQHVSAINFLKSILCLIFWCF